MTIAHELNHLLTTAERSGVGRPVPDALRERVMAYVETQRGAGTAWRTLAYELGLSVVTLRRWSEQAPMPSRHAFHAVHVVSEPSATARGLTVVGPRGVRVEGLSLADAAELLRRLA